MERCSFCGYGIPPGTGKMYVQKDARVLWLCSRRCEKNLLVLGRNPRHLGFTADAKKAKQQAVAAAAHAKLAEAPTSPETTKTAKSRKAKEGKS